MDNPTERGETEMAKPLVLMKRNRQSQKETAKMAEIKAAIEQGKMTLNEARITVGLEPLDNHVANVLIKKV